MHDLATIQRLNREETEKAQRAEAMKRHPAGRRLTEPAQDAERLTPVEAASKYASSSALDLAEVE